MPIIEITTLDVPGVEVFGMLTEAQLRSRVETERGVFIAESPKVIRVALDAGYEPVSLLCERRHIMGDAADIVERCGDIPVYTGERELLSQLTGYTLTRGVLCAMRRPVLRSLEEVCRGARRVAVIDGVSDTTNIGAIFRSAAALGIDAGLQRLGCRTAAMALKDRSLSLDDPVLKCEPRLAVVMGTEGDGLADRTIAEADYVVRIPMAHGVDSLNVAAASAVAFWELRV